MGRRISKADAFGSTHYLWDGDLMVQGQRASQQAVLFIYEPNSFVPLATVQQGQTFWYQCDQIGAPLELTDAQGIAWAADYKVWGEARVWAGLKTGTDGWAVSQSPIPAQEQPFRFQGQQFDAETGLHYNRFRYYDPVVGRFISQDPIGLKGGTNNFQYSPNPVNFVDPMGLAYLPPPLPGRPTPASTGGEFQPTQGSGHYKYHPKCKCKGYVDKKGDVWEPTDHNGVPSFSVQ